MGNITVDELSGLLDRFEAHYKVAHRVGSSFRDSYDWVRGHDGVFGLFEEWS
jgi:hypothetical protein